MDWTSVPCVATVMYPPSLSVYATLSMRTTLSLLSLAFSRALL